MFAMPEQFSSATKSNFDAQLAMLASLTNKAFESVEKVIDLNLNVARESMQESTVIAKTLLSAKDPQEFFAFTASQTQPTTEKALAYGRQLANIASSTQVEFSKAAESQISETNRKVMSMVDDVAKNAPAGSENAVAMVKSVFGNVNAGVEQIAKATKQAAEAVETNIVNVANQFSQVIEKAAAATAAKAA